MTELLGPGPVESARRTWQRCLAEAGWRFRPNDEDLPVVDAVGRWTACALHALWSSPAHELAAMDGIAVRAGDTAGAPVVLDAARFDVVDTGDPLPAGADAVVPHERVRRMTDGRVGVDEPVAAGRHVRPVGEDVTAGEQLLPAGHRLRPVDIAVLAAGGHVRVPVTGTPRVAVLPTGDEVRPVGVPLRRGEVLDTNSPMLAAMAVEAGAVASRSAVIPDEPDALVAAVRAAAATADVVLVIAGSSAGRDDHVPAVLAGLGRVAVRGVAMRPGHPVALGVLTAHEGRPVPVVGVPGYPVAAAHVFATFVAPLLARLTGTTPPTAGTAVVRLARAVASPVALEHTVTVQLQAGPGGETVAVPVLRGAGALSALMRADAVLRIPSGCAGHAEGTRVSVDLLAGAPGAIGGVARAAG